MQVRSAKSLSIPHKVTKLGVKIKEIFFNKYYAKEIHRMQSQRDRPRYPEEQRNKEKKASAHMTY